MEESCWYQWNWAWEGERARRGLKLVQWMKKCQYSVYIANATGNILMKVHVPRLCWTHSCMCHTIRWYRAKKKKKKKMCWFTLWRIGLCKSVTAITRKDDVQIKVQRSIGACLCVHVLHCRFNPLFLFRFSVKRLLKGVIDANGNLVCMWACRIFCAFREMRPNSYAAYAQFTLFAVL